MERPFLPHPANTHTSLEAEQSASADLGDAGELDHLQLAQIAHMRAAAWIDVHSFDRDDPNLQYIHGDPTLIDCRSVGMVATGWWSLFLEGKRAGRQAGRQGKRERPPHTAHLHVDVAFLLLMLVEPSQTHNQYGALRSDCILFFAIRSTAHSHCAPPTLCMSGGKALEDFLLA